ncbi:MAG TPA: methyltransferase domain-containing protein [Methylocella sp.]|nr:methyltransferase domain-containing protein [Methylocella sp.]
MTVMARGTAAPTPYTEAFYEGQQDGSVKSAQVVVPIVLSLFPAHSVVDFGCGVGGWLKEFESNGVSDYLGVDGDYVSRQLLKIPADRFRPLDLRNVGDLGRRFDLACSLEVAEHLPEDRAKSFVAALVKAAPVVLFSAAIPFQGGTDHVNEQWQSYWAKLFAEHGYLAVDCIRPAVFGDSRVEWWYRQNILVFCLPDKCPPGYAPVAAAYDLNRVDPVMIDLLVSRPHSGREAATQLVSISSKLAKAVIRKLRERL